MPAFVRVFVCIRIKCLRIKCLRIKTDAHNSLNAFTNGYMHAHAYYMYYVGPAGILETHTIAHSLATVLPRRLDSK